MCRKEGEKISLIGSSEPLKIAQHCDVNSHAVKEKAVGGVYVDFHNVFDNSLEFLVEYPNDFLTEGNRMISHTWGKTGSEVYGKQTISHGEI